MNTTVTRPTAPAATPSPHTIAAASSLTTAIFDAVDVVVGLDLDDPRWDELGSLLTAFVDAARHAVGVAGSPIRPDEQVVPVLRLRDLARLVTRTAGSTGRCTAATPQVSSCLRSLQNAARRQSG